MVLIVSKPSIALNDRAELNKLLTNLSPNENSICGYVTCGSSSIIHQTASMILSVTAARGRPERGESETANFLRSYS